ncbi:hypothetical protein [Micromonospora purpureochromogenes]|uniref:LPXTG-motif cell wall anchor domain-containing protein n=1 Tax=Micromonospora purpureochromogenes TaxID=47872 RepID=A0ABX2RU17_9ACTN|nr:hypothetical protein [Micromonospora purpureochromogenes]NYF59686.1 hypothetical protein [Micromonospora purpureochromogenes]
MIINRSWRRRSLTALGAALVGLAGALILVSPASADPADISVNHEASCTADGTYQVRWTVLVGSAPAGAERFRFVSVEQEPADSTLDGIAASPEGDFPHAVGEVLTGIQKVPGTATGAQLIVWLQWDNGYTDPSGYSGYQYLDGRCGQEPTEPTAAFESRCDGSMLVDLANPPGGRTVDMAISSIPAGFSRTVTLRPGRTVEDILVPAGYYGLIVAPVGTPEPLTSYAWARPGRCGTADIRSRSTCDELVIVVANPADGPTLDVTFDPNHGRGQQRTLEPETKVEVSFRAVAGLAVVLRSDQFDPPGAHNGPYAWKQPADCGSGGGEGGGLPVTGMPIGGLLAGAGLLLTAGATLVVLARRRRVRFTG